MRIDPDSWCALTSRWRCICWAVSSTLIVLLVTGVQARLRDRQLATGQAQQVRDTNINAGLWAAVRKLTPPAQVQSPAITRPFSPLEFDTGDRRMVRWQPGNNGGELVVEAGWAQIPTLFSTLAQRDIAVARFSIQPEKKTLQVVMQLERQNAG